MGAYVEENRMNSQFNSLPEESKLGFSSSVSRLNDKETLIDKFKNTDLNLDSIDRKSVLDDTESLDAGTYILPVRPDAGDCVHYIRTGACKYGVICRFNHPVMRNEKVFKDKNQSPGKFNKIECKYYLTAGGCKHGIFCKFGHSQKRPDTKLNVIGLPIRTEERVCSYYMRYGSCGYGAECVFHHPEPTLIGGFDTVDPSFEDESMIKYDFSFINSTINEFKNENSCDESVNLHPQSLKKSSEWSVYQVPYVIHESSTVTEENKAEMIPEIKLEGSPEQQLSQTLCSYLLKNGDCKFKSCCHFYHPENWVPISSGLVLSDKGLPLTPDREVCRNYRHFGICKSGSACLFDHPIDLALAPTQVEIIGEDTDF